MKRLIYFLFLFLFGCSSLIPSYYSQVPENLQEEVDLSFDYRHLPYHPEKVLLRIRSGTSFSDLSVSLEAQFIKGWESLGWALFEIPKEEDLTSFLKRARTHEEVLFAQPDLLLDFMEPLFDDYLLDDTGRMLDDQGVVQAEWFEERLWGMKDIRAHEAWELGYTGSEQVIVVVVDTGVKMDHPAFQHHFFIGPFNATNEGRKDEARDVHGHGTHVAGIAVNNGRTGKLAGVSWDSPIMPVRVMDSSGNIYTSYLINALEYIGNYARENPEYRMVVNMSIGGRGYNVALKDAIDDVLGEGVILVTSGGNEYKRVISFPSSYNGLVTVAATTPNQVKADFSSTGWWNSVGAPGTLIWSAYVERPYVALQGTSMASPHVAGAVALLLAKDQTLTPLQVKNQIEQSARPGAYGEGFTEELGYGIIDVVAMLGDLKPLVYGSLLVQAAIVDEKGKVGYGVICIFHEERNLVAFGTTGERGGHTFHALKPGTYLVTLSYEKVFLQEEVTILGDEKTTLTFSFPEP